MSQSTDQKLLVFGATGGTGQAIVRQALSRNIRVTALARDPLKARALFADEPASLTLTLGDAAEASDVMRSFGQPVDAVIDALGIFQRSAGVFGLTATTKNIIAAMEANHVRRYICVSSLGVGDSAGQGNLIARLIQRTTLKHTLADKQAQEDFVRQRNIDWTFIRPSRLVNGITPQSYITWTGAQPRGRLSWEVRREHVAAFALDCLKEAASINCAYGITGCKL